MSASRILIVGVGELGGQLAIRLASKGHKVFGLRRNPKPITEGVEVLSGDVSDLESLLDLPDDIDYLVYSVASPQFSNEGYRKYYVQGLNNILRIYTTRNQALKHVFFVSSTSVYHQKEGETVDENSPTEPCSFAGKNMLEAEKILAKHAFSSSVIRLGGIYGPGRNRLINQVIHGGHCDLEPQLWTNRIHCDDCVGILDFLLEQAMAGKSLKNVYLGTDCQPSTLYEVLEWLKDRIGDVEPDSEGSEVTRRGSKRCDNHSLLELGYHFKYPNYQIGYDSVLKSMGY